MKYITLIIGLLVVWLFRVEIVELASMRMAPYTVVLAGIVVGGGVYIFRELKKARATVLAYRQRKEAERQAAKRAYESALKELEADNSTEHKKRALESGRKYAALSREAHDGDKSVTLFDEIALTNDINARIK